MASVSVASGRSNAARFSSSCSTDDAPTITDPCACTKGRVRHQRTASWAGVKPASLAEAAATAEELAKGGGRASDKVRGRGRAADKGEGTRARGGGRSSMDAGTGAGAGEGAPSGEGAEGALSPQGAMSPTGGRRSNRATRAGAGSP